MHEGAQSCRPYLPFSSALATRVRIAAVSVGFFKVFHRSHTDPASAAKLFKFNVVAISLKESKETRVSRRGKGIKIHKAVSSRQRRRGLNAARRERETFELVRANNNASSVSKEGEATLSRFRPRIPSSSSSSETARSLVARIHTDGIFKKRKKKETKSRHSFKVNALPQSWRTWMNSLSLSPFLLEGSNAKCGQNFNPNLDESRFGFESIRPDSI